MRRLQKVEIFIIIKKVNYKMLNYDQKKTKRKLFNLS